MLVGDLAAMLDLIRPGDTVFLGGSSGEPLVLLDAWRDDPERTRGLSVISSAVAGINRFDCEGWHDSSRLTGLFMQPACAAAQSSGRYRWLPYSYGGFARHLMDGREAIDVAVVMLSPPGPDGNHSLGLTAEFMPIVLRQAKRVLGIVNHAMPFVAHAPRIAPERLDATCVIDQPLTGYEPGGIDGGSQQIADLIAPFVDDGAALQVGIGKVPAALGKALTSRRGLRIQSGMIGEGFMQLQEAGALDPQWRHEGCAVVGSQQLYDWIADRTDYGVACCDRTHDPARLAGTAALVAVNSAVEVDLLGQCNLEHVSGRPISGVGGAPDFARAARLSAGGLSIVALPATAARGTASRICATLPPPHLASIPRYDVDIVVTEFGAADLRGLSVQERAERLTAIAAPAFRAELAEQGRALLGSGRMLQPQ